MILSDYIFIDHNEGTVNEYREFYPVDTDEEIDQARAAMRAAGIEEAPIYRGVEDSVKTSLVLVAKQEVVNA
jgi:hypothetical protein